MNKVIKALRNARRNIKKRFKQNALLRAALVSTLVLSLMVTGTLAWYMNNLSIFGIEFNTGYIDFNAYVFDKDGVRLTDPISSNSENESNHINAPLITVNDAQVGTTGTAYIAVESTGSIGIQYRIAFGISGKTENSIAYLGGYKYNISKVTNSVVFNKTGNIDVSGCDAPEKINDELITIDRNAVNGTIATNGGYDVYRIDYTLAQKNEEYTGGGIGIYFNVFATQIDGDFEDDSGRGYTYYCASKEDIDRAKIEAYPGDTIKLSSDIVYYGDLVFNKPLNLLTNDYTLTVNGNLMYDYVLGNSLKIDAGGLGKIIVQCANNGIGGNFQIKAPISDVTLVGSNASNGDIVVESNVIIDATNAFGSAGVSFNEVRIVDLKNSRKTIQLESNTRATVAFGTNIGIFQAVAKASNIEIINNGEIGLITLTYMSLLDQTNSPQIYILNNNDITNPISLPIWSVKFVEDANGVCTGNTRIIQSYSGSTTTVVGDCTFANSDVEVEKKDFLVEQIEEGNDSRLRIYYQDVNGQTTTIKSILEDYLANGTNSGTAIYEISELEIVSIGDKAITATDISFMNSDSMLSLNRLDMQRANIYDARNTTMHKLPDAAFQNVSKYESLVLPQNLVEIGTNAFRDSNIENIITIPSSVAKFGNYWFANGNYVQFASSVPIVQPSGGITNVNAIFVDEAYILSYKSTYTSYANKIYPTSVMDETKTHFVRNIGNDEWEITYLIGGEDNVIGNGITIDGTILKITCVYDNAYRYNYVGTVVNFADTVKNLGANNFHSNKNITSANLNNIEAVGDYAFYSNSALVQVNFGENLQALGAYAFTNCISLNQDVVLPETMLKIGAYAFQKSKITSIKAGGTLSIDGKAFANCTDLVYAELPNVKIIDESAVGSAFDSCSLLVSVSMPSLTKVGGLNIFNYCTSLRELYMGATDDNLTLGSKPFNGCDMTKLKLFVPEENIEFYRTKRPGSFNTTMIYPAGEKMGEEFVNGFNIGVYIVGDNGDGTCMLITSNVNHSGELVIPESFNGKMITRIYNNAFRNQVFTNVTLDLGDSIKSIGDYAFYKLSGLNAVEFGDSLTDIGIYAFGDCVNMTQSIELPDTMLNIGDSAFRGTSILSINTGGTISVGDSAFYNCTSLIYSVMPEVTVIAPNATNNLFYKCESLVSVDMPKATSISGTYMFAYCNSLREIYMGGDNSAITLGTNAFYQTNISKLKLYVPENLLSLYQQRKLIDVNRIFPRGEKLGDEEVNGFIIGDYIVMKNDNGYTIVTSNLEFEGEVIVPNEYNGEKITEVYTNAFRSQTFTDAKLIFGDNMRVIGNNAFYGLTGIKTVVINQVTSVGTSSFFGSGIETLNAPKLIKVGNDAFRKCVNLKTVSIPEVQTISNTYTFAQCTVLKDIYFKNILSIDRTTFYQSTVLEKIVINRQINANKDNMPSTITIEPAAPCKIYVPYRSLWAYTATWSSKPVVSFDISATNNGDTYILTDNNGRYSLIDFIPGQTSDTLIMPVTVTSDDLGEISIYFIQADAFATVGETLKHLTLSSTITGIDSMALNECAALENIYVDAANNSFVSVNGVLYSKDTRMLVKYPIGRSGAFDMSGADYEATIIIGANAFTNATGLTQIVFPSSLMMIDSTAFDNCTKLNTVEFTGDTPPVLMSEGIFDTTVEDFVMIIPIVDTNVVNAYLTAYNFVEYLPYINLTASVQLSEVDEPGYYESAENGGLTEEAPEETLEGENLQEEAAE